MTFFLYSVFGDGLVFAPLLINEKAEVSTFIENAEFKRLYDGIIPKYESLGMWMSKITKDDIVVFDSNSDGTVAVEKKLRAKGITNIIGGSEFAHKLEHDRVFGMKLLAENGVNIPETYAFKNNAEGITFLKKNNGKYVYKPCGEGKASTQTYVGTTSEDMVSFIQKQPNQDYILQKFVEGGICELGVEMYFSKGNPLIAPSHTIELKKYGVGNTGPNTGCMSSVTWFDDEIGNPTTEQTWEHLFDVFKKEGYTGACDISGIVDKKGKFWALEFTPRFGFSQELALYQLLKEKISTFWEYLAKGWAIEIDRAPEYFGLCARVGVHPYPVESTDETKEAFKAIIKANGIAGKPVVIKDHDNIDYNFMDIKTKDDGLVMAGVHAILVELATRDKDLAKAEKRVWDAFKDIQVGDTYTRKDMFTDAIEQMPKLKSVGFWGSSKL